MNNLERVLGFWFIIIIIGLILRYYKGAVAITKEVGTQFNDLTKTLSLQGVGYAY